MSTVLIPVRKGPVEEATFVYAVVDAEDANGLFGYRWHLDHGYARRCTRVGGRNGKMASILMHRQLMDLEIGDGLELDHINRNKLDNRRANLRLVTRAENKQNLDSYANSTSRYRGVSWSEKSGKWIAQIKLDGEAVCLGRFSSEEEAARVAAEARRQRMPFSEEARVA